MKKILLFFLIVFVFSSFVNAYELDYTTGTVTLNGMSQYSTCPNYCTDNLIDGDDDVIIQDFFLSTTTANTGDSVYLTFNTSYYLTSVGVSNLHDSTGATYPFDYELFAGTTSIYNGSFDGTNIDTGANITLTTPIYTDNISVYITDDYGSGYYLAIGELYAYGNSSLPNITNFTINAKSFWDNSSLTNFSANVSGTLYNTTTGLITTNILDNDTNLYNITVYTNNRFNYTTLNYNVSSNLVTYLKQSEINFNCYDKISNNLLSCINSTIYPDTNTYNFTVGVSGYYNITQEETISALDNKTININDFYSTNLTFLNNFVNGPGGASCNYTTTGITYPSFNEVSQNYTGLINGTYNIMADCENYAYSYENVTIQNISQNVTFDLYTTNSIEIFIYDETTGLIINNTNITVTKTFGATQTENVTSDGTISYEYLDAGNYTFSFTGTSYPKRNYNIEIGNKTYQTLNVYLLSNSTDAVIFTFQEYTSQNVIEAVSLQISTLVNSTNTLISVLNSDITGRVQFYFDTTKEYCFEASKTGYTTKSFCLDPIIFSSYTIKLQTNIDANTNDDFENVLIDFISPSKFWNNQNNTVSFKFASAGGQLTNYGFNATYDTTTISASGTNAYGSILSNDLEISGAEYGDKVTVYYFYKISTDDDYRVFKRIYEIYGYNSTVNSLSDNPPSDYGLGEFERTLISVLIILLVAGAGAYFGGATAGGILAIFVFAWLMYIQFLNFWAGAISTILLFIIIAWRGTR